MQTYFAWPIYKINTQLKMKTEHYNYTICCRAVALDYINFGKVYLINQVS